ncbi:MAG: hypothetical protein OSJ27_06650 [Candidatus Gastranaerophilales bacterium]|nr:hypothetical protein [Candidatus Gastranaerophilales bacterium]
MLRINSISNVNNTLKNNISFRAGVQTNYGIKSTNDNVVEKGIFTGFVGILKDSPLFNLGQVSSRADKIEKGLNETKLNVVA